MRCALTTPKKRNPRNPIVREWAAKPKKGGKHQVSERKQKRREKEKY